MPPGRYEICGNSDQPDHRDITADSCPSSQNGDADDHLDNADDVHERGGVDRQNLLQCRTQILGPVGQNIEELVQTRQKRN